MTLFPSHKSVARRPRGLRSPSVAYALRACINACSRPSSPSNTLTFVRTACLPLRFLYLSPPISKAATAVANTRRPTGHRKGHPPTGARGQRALNAPPHSMLVHPFALWKSLAIGERPCKTPLVAAHVTTISKTIRSCKTRLKYTWETTHVILVPKDFVREGL